MSFDISTIEGYVNEHKNELIAQMVATNTSARTLNLQTGYKGAAALNLMSTDVVFQDGSVSGWTPDGTTTLSQRILTPGDVKVQEGLDPKQINKTYLQHSVRAGSYEDSIPFEQEYAEAKTKRIANATEIAIWQGDTASLNDNLNKFDGFLKIIAAEAASVVEGNTSSATSITKANVIGLVDDMYAVLPVDVLEAEDLVLMVGFDTARLYSSALKDADLTHYKSEDGRFEFMIPSTNVRLVATAGLNGTERMILGRAENLVIGVDLENEEEDFKMFYSEDDFIVKFHANFKTGTQVAFPDEIVEFTVSA